MAGRGQDGPGDTGFTAITRTSESVLQSLLADIAILNTPVSVGMPEIVAVDVE